MIRPRSSIHTSDDARTCPFSLSGCWSDGPGLSASRLLRNKLERSQFEGIIAGPPCQDFSRARRRPPSGHGIEMLRELARLITEAQPEWWLVENVPGVPTIRIEGFTTQRFNMFASDFGLDHRRNRSFQFGSKGEKLVIPRGRQSHLKMKPTPLASDYARSRKRNFADLCERMGLPRRFTLLGLSRRAQFRVVGQGVPVVMARAVAIAICDRQVTVTAASQRLCPCDCGRPLTGKQKAANAACRKRLQRKRQHREPPTLALASSQFELSHVFAGASHLQERAHASSQTIDEPHTARVRG